MGDVIVECINGLKKENAQLRADLKLSDRLLRVATQMLDEARKAKGKIDFTGKEIRDLAEFCGFMLVEQDYADEEGSEITVKPCPVGGILCDEDKTASTSKYIAYFTEYPEEGCLNLGETDVAAISEPVV